MNELSKLNERQKEAVLATEGPVAVIAGAGSGKTRVLTHRIAHLLEKGVPGERVLAITFTNKAAREMRERLGEMLAGRVRELGQPMVSTFHSLGVYILREFGAYAGIKKHFNIYDRRDSTSTIKGILEAMGVDTKTTEPRAILARISKEKNNGVSLADFADMRKTSFFEKTVLEVWQKYKEQLRAQNAFDFDDLLTEPVALINSNEKVADLIKTKWDYILVDEYQDTNLIQSKLITLLTEKKKNIFVVGDIDQSIYTWRGATIENMLGFSERYKDAKHIYLTTNYRSSKNIVNGAQNVIEKNTNRHDKKSDTINDAGEKISLVINIDERCEASFVAKAIEGLAIAGTAHKDIAVLYRTNFQSRILEEYLLAEGIPYQVLGTKFFDRKEIKDVLAYLRLALNPESITDITRIINVPKRGIGKATLLKIVEKRELSGAAAKRAGEFFNIMSQIREHISSNRPSEIIKKVAQLSGMEREMRDGTEEEQERFENIEELVTLSTKFDGLSGEDGILALLEEAALMSEQDSMDGGGVKLMTVHASKGLEFDVVFVTGLEEGLFPHEKTDSEYDPEEERRLFYVAMTRAKKKLFLSFAQMRRIYGTQVENVPSSFIGDIEQEYIELEDGGDRVATILYD